MIDIDTKELERLHLEENGTVRSIGKIYGVSPSTVRQLLIKKGIKLRPKGNIEGKEYHFTSPFKIVVKEEDNERLIQLFNECLPINDIAAELNVNRHAIERRVRELNLVRPKSMMSREHYDPSLDANFDKLYKEGKSLADIGKTYGVTPSTIKHHLKRYGTNLRTLSESQFICNNKEFPKELKDYDITYDLYVIQKKSKKEIGELFNIDPSTVDRVLRDFDIHVRNDSESKIGLFSGSNHPNWKGGRTSLYRRLREYFGERQTTEVLKRDYYSCQLCGKKHENLHVHHIKPFKAIFEEILLEHPDLDVTENKEELYEIMINDSRMNDLDNLITYCKDCHLFKIHGYKKREILDNVEEEDFFKEKR